MKPKISVIIPVYNTEAYIEETLQSVMDQTLTDIEIIIINDGSTDSSLEIIEKMASTDKRIQVYSQPNQGQSVARNAGIEKATGEYIHFMDSDDLLMPEAYEECFSKCKSSQLDFTFFDADILYEKRNPSSRLCFDYIRAESIPDRVYKGDELLEYMLKTSTYRASPILLLIRTRFLKEQKLLFYPGIIHEDELFAVNLYLHAQRVAPTASILAVRRVRGDSTTTRRYSYKNVQGYLTVFNQLNTYAAQAANAYQKKIIRQYIRYTINPVFQTAKSLPWEDKIKTLRICYEKGYLKYAKLRSIAVLLLKK